MPVAFASVRLDAYRKGVREQRDRLPVRPTISGEGHRDVAGVRGSLRAQVARRLHRLDTALRAIAAERAALRCGVCQLLAIVRPPCRSLRLQDRVLLRAVRSTGDVLRRLVRQPELGCTREKALFLRSHRGRLNRKRVLDPLVVRDQFAVTERRDVMHGRTIPRRGRRSPRKLQASREASWRSSARWNRRHPPSARESSSAAGREPRAAGCGRRARSGRRLWPDCSPRSRSATTRARCARRRPRLPVGARRGRVRRVPSPRQDRRRRRRRR